MVSNTKQTEAVRSRKRRRCGRKRRAIDRTKGTTPKFPIHVK